MRKVIRQSSIGTRMGKSSKIRNAYGSFRRGAFGIKKDKKGWSKRWLGISMASLLCGVT